MRGTGIPLLETSPPSHQRRTPHMGWEFLALKGAIAVYIILKSHPWGGES